MAWWLWILLGLAFLGLELAVPGGFILFFFGVAALLVGIIVATALSIPVWMEWVAFSVLSVVLLCGFRRRLVALLGKSSADEVDTFIGKDVELVDSIAPGEKGQVRLRGAPWQAVNVGEGSLAAGDNATVQAVEGLVLKIK